MENISDERLLEELKARLDQRRRSLSDISVMNRKLVEMNRRLEQSESLKSNFLSNIRNEINNPLNAIIGLAGHLASLVNDPQAGEVAAMIFSEAFNLDYQLRNIFIAAELEAGETQPNIELVDVVSVITNILDSFRAMADGKQVTLKFSLMGTDDQGRIYFPTDAEKLQVIVSNLVANAIEFSTEAGQIDLLIGHLESELHIQVKDQGIGIAEDDLERIFDRFIQLDIGSTRAHHGHGLGLSITKALLDLLQGTIQVQSSPGVGSVFSVTLFPAAFDESGVTFAEGGNLFLFDEMDEK